MTERDQQIKRLKEKRDAYVQLFGTVDKPTPLGEIVLRDLKAFTKHGLEPHHFDTTQRLDTGTTMYRLGKQMVYQRIIETLQWREPNEQRSGSNDDRDDYDPAD